MQLLAGQRLAAPLLLTQHGLVRREGRGTAVYYRIADDSVYALCDLVCGSIARRYQRNSQPFPGV